MDIMFWVIVFAVIGVAVGALIWWDGYRSNKKNSGSSPRRGSSRGGKYPK